jgi:hypothetical protein
MSATVPVSWKRPPTTASGKEYHRAALNTETKASDQSHTNRIVLHHHVSSSLEQLSDLLFLELSSRMQVLVS